MASDLFGHDNNFLETPPDELTCPICHCVARDPLQTQCCGTLYCESCLDQLEDQNEDACPTCRARSFSTFTDHISNRRIKALKVVCDNEEKGCKWTGELDHLEQHIAVECMLVEVPCSNDCSMILLRRNMEKHLKHKCPRREYKCPHCKELGEYQTMTSEHLEECPDLIILCPNDGCHVRKTRLEIEVHRKTCPKEEVTCSYFEIGCDGYQTREALEQHETECMEHHLQLAMKEITSLKATTASLQAITASLQVVTASMPPPVFRMSDFRQHKEEERPWYSPFFYSHQSGYMMRLAVYAHGWGEGRGSHISAFVFLIENEKGNQLIWPFRGEVTFAMLNQLANSSHFTTTVKFEEEIVTGSNQSPKRTSVRGYHKLIKHEELDHDTTTNCQYLKDDCLYFRVSAIKVYDSNKPWLTTCSKSIV